MDDDFNRKAIKRTYKAMLPGLQKAARECGYALAVHGSMSRDLDLIAVPWVEDAKPAAELAFQLAVSCNGLIVGNDFEEPYRRLFHINMPWRGTENRNYIELSVTPKCKEKIDATE